LSSKDERAIILALSKEDARLFIDITDRVRFSRTVFDLYLSIVSCDVKALRAGQLERELRLLAFTILRRLCSRIGHLPDSYLLSNNLELSQFLCGSSDCSDLRMGVFKRRNVAVKTLRVPEMDDEARVRKVGNQAVSSYIGSLTDLTALL